MMTKRYHLHSLGLSWRGNCFLHDAACTCITVQVCCGYYRTRDAVENDGTRGIAKCVVSS